MSGHLGKLQMKIRVSNVRKSMHYLRSIRIQVMILPGLFIMAWCFLLNDLDLTGKYSKPQRLWYPSAAAFSKNGSFHQSYNSEAMTGGSRAKVILLWTQYWSKYKLWIKVFSRHRDSMCPENDCIFTRNKSLFARADAVVFHAPDLPHSNKLNNIRRTKLPSLDKKHPGQVWIFMSLEPPTNLLSVDLKKLKNYFNWTMTYRRDSDIVVPYGLLIAKPGNYSLDSPDVSAAGRGNRTKMAIWIASHCPSFSKREDLVQQLSRYIEIDTYGECGKKKCGTRTTLPNLKSEEFDKCDYLIENYLFYLAFENAVCKDYITEKVFRALKLGAIPVILGGINTTSFLPPSSYVDASKFTSTKDLALYMKRIADDPELYARYFAWKKYYDVEIGHPYRPFTCDLCLKLHNKEFLRATEGKFYKDIFQWFQRDSHCTAARKLENPKVDGGVE